jgi:hypothetical protein
VILVFIFILLIVWWESAHHTIKPTDLCGTTTTVLPDGSLETCSYLCSDPTSVKFAITLVVVQITTDLANNYNMGKPLSVDNTDENGISLVVDERGISMNMIV